MDKIEQISTVYKVSKNTDRLSYHREDFCGYFSWFLPFLLIALTAGSEVFGKQIYVGSSPSADYATIQEAIDQATVGDIVLVESGEYVIDTPIDFLGKAITVKSQESSQLTIIRMSETPADPYFASVVRFGNGETESAVLDGFTLTGGKGIAVRSTSSGNWLWLGGGIWIGSSSPRILNCVVTNNSVNEGGGGIYCSNANPQIAYCEIVDNSAGFAGSGIYCDDSSPQILDCEISNNGTSHGGGLYISEGDGNPVFIGCIFEGNTGVFGGGIEAYGHSITLNNCTFTNNSSMYLGGGVDIHSGSAQIDNCRFLFNQSNATGGGIHCSINTTVEIRDSFFIGNSASDGGGGIGTSQCTLSLTNCLIVGNRATGRYDWFILGGGIECASLSEVTLTNCTVSQNRSITSGGGIGVKGYGNTTVVNCIISDNIAHQGGAEISGYPEDTLPTYLSISSSLIRGGQTGIPPLLNPVIEWGDGNIDTDPLFAELGQWNDMGTPDDYTDDIYSEGDYHLKSQAGRYDPTSQSWITDETTSPCIDAGDLSSPMGIEPFPNGCVINMGAYGGIIEASKSYFPTGLCEPVQFNDPNLKAAVEQELGIQDPTSEDMLLLEILVADRLGIVDLTGLDYAINLKQLRLYGNNIIDITPLRTLVNLESLTLGGGNQIVDISSLSGMTQLTTLALGGNRIYDISSLITLSRLESLNLAWNGSITDIGVLTAFPNLKQVHFGGSPIGDYEANLEILAGLTQLEVLGLGACHIPNLNFLSELCNLKDLVLFNNSFIDITLIANLTKLETLRINMNEITDLSALTSLYHLFRLEVQDNPLSYEAYCEQIPQIIRNNPDIDLLLDPNPYYPDYAGDLWGTGCGVNMEDLILLVSHWLEDLPANLSKLDLAPEVRDGRIDFQDFAVLTSQWMGDGTIESEGMSWIYISDPGVSGHEEFNGFMSKYETTNAQYCAYLNAALASDDITIDTGGHIYGASGSNGGIDYIGEPYSYTMDYALNSQIVWDGIKFTARIRDDYDMSDHPVLHVSWYGAMAFASYYGWRLPTEWEWQAVADYDGSYTYGCGTTLDLSKANYFDLDNGYANPLDLDNTPYTSPVGYYPAYGYGMCDMTGNVWEWTNSYDGDLRIVRGGSYDSNLNLCTVSRQNHRDPELRGIGVGFRVCR